MKKSLIIAGVVLVLVVGGLFGAPYLISTDGLLKALQIHVKDATGQDLAAQSTRLRLIPWPTFTLEGVAIARVGTTEPPLLTADQIDASLDIVSLFKGELVLAGLSIHSPKISVAQAPAASTPAPPVVKDWLPPLKQDAYLQQLSSLTITDGSILYQVGQSGATDQQWRGLTALEADMNVSLTAGSLEGTGTGIFDNKPVTFSASLEPAERGVKMKIKASRDDTELAYDGTMVRADGIVSLAGLLDIKTNDIWPWLQVQGAVATPMTWKSQLRSDGSSIQLTHIQTELAGSKADGSMDIALDPSLNGKGTLHFTLLDADQMITNLEAASMPVAPTDASNPGKQMLFPFLSETVQLLVNITADKMRLRQHDLTKFDTELQLLGGEMNINRASAVFPGDSQLSLIGLVKRRDGSMTLEGRTEGAGQDLFALLSMLPIALERMPANELKRFRMKGNVFFSDKQVRLSEGQLLVEKSYMTGAIVAFLNQQPRRYEAVLRAQDIDLDPYVEAYRTGGKAANAAAAGWDWLKNLSYQLELTAQFNNFVLHEMKGAKMQLKLAAKPGSLELNEINADMEKATITGSLHIEPRSPQPWVKAALNFSQLPATALLKVTTVNEAAAANAPKNTERWSGTAIDFSRLKGWSGEFDLGFGTLDFPTFSMGDVKTKATLQNSVLDIGVLTSELWGGHLRASGSIDVSDIPKIQSTFALDGIDADGILGTAFDIHAMNGTLNASGTLATSGLSPRSWISSASGGFGIAGRKIRVKGFDLPRVARGMGAVRSVADIVNVARLAFQSGETEFSTLQGDIYVQNGVARTNNLKLVSEVANGNLSGTLSMPAWNMDLNTLFTLQYGEEKEPPVLGVRFTGSLDNPETTFDTSLVEAYIAKKAAERLLQ